MPPAQEQKNIDKKPNLKKALLAGIVFVVLLLITAALFVVFNTYQKSQARPCTEDEALLARSSSLLPPQREGEAEEFSQLAQNIEQLPDYDQDINCMFILANFYLYQSEITKAEEALDTTKTLHDGGQKISAVFGGRSIEDLENRLKILEELFEEASNNSFVIPGTEASDEEAE